MRNVSKPEVMAHLCGHLGHMMRVLSRGECTVAVHFDYDDYGDKAILVREHDGSRQLDRNDDIREVQLPHKLSDLFDVPFRMYCDLAEEVAAAIVGSASDAGWLVPPEFDMDCSLSAAERAAHRACSR